MKLKNMNKKRKVVFSILTAMCIQASSQIIIRAEEKDNNILLSSERKTLNAQNSYTIIVKGLNSTKYTVTVEPKFTRKKVEIPQILGPIMPKTNATIENVPKELLFNLKQYVNITDKYNKRLNLELYEATKAGVETIKKAQLIPSFKLVFENIDESASKLKKLKTDFEELYRKPDSVGFVNKARAILNNATSSAEIQTNSKIYDQEIRNAINSFNANVDLLEALVANLSLDNFSGEFIQEYTKVKGSSQFVLENKELFFKMIKFIVKGANASEHIEFNKTEIKGDFTSIEVTVVKTNEDLTTKTFVVNQEFSNRNYIKWLNITTGFFGNNLVNPDFAVSSDKHSIITEKGFQYDVSVGAMANINYVLRPEFKVGIGFGIALSPFDAKTRYMLGPTLTFGVKNEFALSGGVVWSKLQALSGSISSNGKDYNRPLAETITTTTIDKESTNQTTNQTTNTHDVTHTTVTNIFGTIPTYSKWYRGIYIGITYSFLKR